MVFDFLAGRGETEVMLCRTQDFDLFSTKYPGYGYKIIISSMQGQKGVRQNIYNKSFCYYRNHFWYSKSKIMSVQIYEPK